MEAVKTLTAAASVAAARAVREAAATAVEANESTVFMGSGSRRYCWFCISSSL